MANISQIQLPSGVTYNIKDETSGYITGMTILSYGSSTWQNFIDAYNANKVVYCRASSNNNPATGSQTRLAFMAYVNNATTPTEVEFQYYRSVSSHSASQQGDQVFVYKLTSANKWTVTTREAASKVAAGGDLTRSYSNGTVTISGTMPTVPTNVSAFTNDAGYITGYTETDPIFTASAAHGISSSDITNWNGKQAALVSGTNIKTVNGNSLLGSGDLAISGGGAKNVWYGTCSTGSNTNQKVATTTSGDFTLTTGNIVSITFSNANGVSASLNVDNTGDVSIRMTSGSSVNALYWTAGETVTFVYNGTYYLAVGKGTATTTYYGVTRLSTSTSSTSTSLAATPYAVKSAYDLANGKQDALVSGTNIKTINNNSLLGSGDLSIPTGTTATVTQVSLTVANWNATTTCTKTVTGVTASNSIIVSPAPASIADYVSAGVYCSAQGSGTLTFTASSTPTADLVVNVMIVG